MTRPAFRRTARILPAAACAAAAAAFTVGPLAQTGTGQLSGTVFDARQKGAAGLSVAAVPDDGGFLHGTCTDQDGRYDFRGLPSGSYSILVSGPAGVLRKDGIRLRPLFRSIVDFSLAADAAVSGLPTLIGRPGGASAPASGAARPPAGAPDGASSTAPGPAPPQNGRAGEEAAVPDPGTPAVAVAPAAPAQPAASPGHASDAPGLALAWRLREAGREAAPDVWITATPSGGAGALRRARTDQEGAARLEEVLAGTYRISARAPGYITWSLGPIPIQGTGVILLDMTLVPFPMGFPGSLEDLLVPADPIRTYEP